MTTDWKNKLFFGDNLGVMREHIPDESVDLIYLDPPFNSKATYNVLFAEKDGSQSSSQITAFEDTWHWDGKSELAYRYLVQEGPDKLARLVEAYRSFLGDNDMMAYLVMMAIRLVEMHRVLKPTGSIYLHCDPTASHYLKLVMDAVFGVKFFKNEIIWHYTGWNKKLPTHFEKRHDIILYYSKRKKPLFNSYSMPWESEEEYVKTRKQKVQIDNYGEKYVMSDAGNGKRIKRYIKEAMEYGRPIDTVWEIDKLNNSAKESLGYPTQKPEALLERIINASSNEGDVVMDPFCGCGTAVAVAERLNRRWIGIDITHLAIGLMRSRLQDTFGEQLAPYEVIGDPKDLESARALAAENRYQFEWWALGLIGARPAQDKKKGADRGIDGKIRYFDDKSGKPKTIIVQVKSGHVKRGDIATLKGDLEREKAVIGAFVTLEEPTRPMIQEAAAAGFYEAEMFGPVPRIQILTIKDLLEKRVRLDYHELQDTTFKKAEPKRKGEGPKQDKLFG